MIHIKSPFSQTSDLRCAFTGHRPQKLPFGFDESDPRCREFKLRIEASIEVLIVNGFTHFISGGALGMDMFAAEAVLRLKRKYPHIRLEMAIPFRGQSERWAVEYRERYERLIAHADMMTVLGDVFDRNCVFHRNRYMVDNADILLACYSGGAGGTGMTVQYARRTGIPVALILPEKRLASLGAA